MANLMNNDYLLNLLGESNVMVVSKFSTSSSTEAHIICLCCFKIKKAYIHEGEFIFIGIELKIYKKK